MATSADDGCGGRVVRGISRVKDAAKGVDGLALKAEAYVGVDADVGVAEEFLDHDEFDALFRKRVAAECRRSWNRIGRSPAHGGGGESGG